MKTIAALATAQGIGGLAVIRVSGDESIDITDMVFKSKFSIKEMKSHTIQYGKIIDEDSIIDTVTISLFKAPNSYTGEDVVEIASHGGVVVSSLILDLLYKSGAIPATAGEFTKRAFINNKLDLVQVEAVADLIHSLSYQSARTAARQLSGNFSNKLKEFRYQLVEICSLLEIELDFLDDDLEFAPKDNIINKINSAIQYCSSIVDSQKSSQILRSGYYVAIIGFPNSGKSTLFNTLLQKKRAIVSEIPGTTRDYIEESFLINGLPIKLIDTAGIRDSKNIIEIQGIALVEEVIKQANLILILNDTSSGIDNSNDLYSSLESKYPATQLLLVQNKIDKANVENADNKDIFISAKMGIGLDTLLNNITDLYKQSLNINEDIILNQRHSDILARAIEQLKNAISAINNGYENEIISIDIKSAANILGELTGESFNDDVLNSIFSKFCIGK